MKGVFVFNSLNDLIFAQKDCSLEQHLQQQALENGYISYDSDDRNTLSTDVIVQLFSPLLTSHVYMCELRQDPYQTIKLKDGTIYVIETIHDIVMIAVSNSEDESETLVHRKLLILQKIMGLLVGPVKELIQLSSSTSEQVNPYNTQISAVLSTWSALYATDQCFLVEAIERLQLNEMLNYKCVSLLESAMSKLSQWCNVTHAFLLIQSQLVALYSVQNASKLEAAELLLLILFSRSVFPSANSRSESSESTSAQHKPQSSDNAVDAAELLGPNEEELLGVRKQYFRKHCIFLETNHSKYTPFTLYTQYLMDDIVLLILCEASDSQLSGIVYQSMSVVRTLLSPHKHEASQTQILMDIVENNLKKLYTTLKKSKTFPRQCCELAQDNTNKWSVVKQLYQSLTADKHARTQHTHDSQQRTQIRLESSLTSMLAGFKKLFRSLYLPGTQQPLHKNLLRAFDSQYNILYNELYNYKEYFIVRSQRNLSMTSYKDSHPGLLHFLYVDRTHHILLAPPIITELGSAQENALERTIKENVWKIVPYIQIKLSEGLFTQIHRDKQFCYAYYLWFEDEVAPLKCKETFIGCANNVKPGLLAGHFYRQVLKQCFSVPSSQPIKCYELLCVHEASAKNDQVLKNSRQLITALCDEAWQAGSTIKLF